MSRENKQIEDTIIAEAFIKVRNTLALLTIVGLSCWIGYLLSANESKAYTINQYELKKHRDSLTIEQLFEIDLMQDSVINSMPPVELINFINK
jgi:hypothetical protein